MKATLPNGSLRDIEDCYIYIPELSDEIVMRILPDISDSKSANYADESAIGRSFPIKNYAYSENRTISWTIHLMVCKEGDQDDILRQIKLLEACVYPSNKEQPYAPPPICKIKCGKLLAETELCCVLKSYSVKFPTDVAWDDIGYVPYKLDIDLSFEVVYDSSSLPYAEEIQFLGTSI
jgi:hypothetical protein